MAAQRRKSGSLVPQCSTLETRLAPSGNFLSHGYADVVREVRSTEHHHHADHSTTRGETVLGHDMPVHYHHEVAGHVAK